jgi:hypothetical protein
MILRSCGEGLSTKNRAFTSSLYTVLYIRIYMDIYIYTWINKGDVSLVTP